MYCAQLSNTDNYFMYGPMIQTGKMDIQVQSITVESYPEYFNGILNILRDGIETDEVQSMFLNLEFPNGDSIELNIMHFFFNLIMWRPFIDINLSVQPEMIFFPEHITQNDIKSYLDKKFLLRYRDEENVLMDKGYDPETSNIILNRCIDNASYGYGFVDEFSLYLMNTINLKDDIDLAKQNPRFRELLHASFDGVPFESIKDVGMQMTNEAINIIMNSNHCLADSFKAKEGVNPKQYREYLIGKGVVPDGQGSAYPIVVNHSFVNGGVADIDSFFVESSSGRLAQIIAKCNVGTSGAFARILGLNNRDSFLHHDPKYICNSRHFEKIYIKDASYLESFEGRYYRLHPKGIEKCLSLDDTHLIGQNVYFRSPMKCASAAMGEGICYRCYGKLAYTNASINIGQYAAENISAKLTQKQLSAKHLLEAAIIALEWNSHFDKVFEVEYNTVKLKEGIDLDRYNLIINPNDIRLESEEDDFSYNEYINVITIEDTEEYDTFHIYTKNNDALYLSNSLNTSIRKLSTDAVEGDHLSIPLSALVLDDSVFLIRLTNNEFSATLDRISSIINLESVTTSYDSNELLQQFNEAVKNGKLDITSVHLEVILMNQLRNVNDILEMPNWENEGEECKILTLNQALTNNPSITVSMMYQITNVYYNPLSFRKNKPSYLDLLFMEKPQHFFQNKGLYKPDKKKPSKKKPIQLVRRTK